MFLFCLIILTKKLLNLLFHLSTNAFQSSTKFAWKDFQTFYGILVAHISADWKQFLPLYQLEPLLKPFSCLSNLFLQIKASFSFHTTICYCVLHNNTHDGSPFFRVAALLFFHLILFFFSWSMLSPFCTSCTHFHSFRAGWGIARISLWYNDQRDEFVVSFHNFIHAWIENNVHLTVCGLKTIA